MGDDVVVYLWLWRRGFVTRISGGLHPGAPSAAVTAFVGKEEAKTMISHEEILLTRN